jgi:hypothetical protein
MVDFAKDARQFLGQWGLEDIGFNGRLYWYVVTG